MGTPPPEFALERIYVKDLSFESPRSPDVFREPWQPQIQLDINTRTTGLGDERFEVVLTVTVNAKSADGQTLMIVEVQQGGVFRIRGLDEDRLRRVLATQLSRDPVPLYPRNDRRSGRQRRLPAADACTDQLRRDVRRSREARQSEPKSSTKQSGASSTAARVAELPPRFVHHHGHCVRKVQAARVRSHRDADCDPVTGLSANTSAGNPRVSGPNNSASAAPKRTAESVCSPLVVNAQIRGGEICRSAASRLG